MVGVFRASFDDLGTQLAGSHSNGYIAIVGEVHVSLEGPKPLTIWAQLHQFGSNLVVRLRAGSGPLGSVECLPQNCLVPRVCCSAARD